MTDNKDDDAKKKEEALAKQMKSLEGMAALLQTGGQSGPDALLAKMYGNIFAPKKTKLVEKEVEVEAKAEEPKEEEAPKPEVGVGKRKIELD